MTSGTREEGGLVRPWWGSSSIVLGLSMSGILGFPRPWEAPHLLYPAGLRQAQQAG